MTPSEVRPTCRYKLSPLWLIAMLLVAPVVGQGVESTSREQLERDIVRALASGRDAGASMDRLQSLAPSARAVRGSRLPKGSPVAGYTMQALDNLRRVLEGSLGRLDRGDATEVDEELATALEGLRAADLLARARFDRARRALERVGSAAAGERLTEVEAEYRRRLESLFDALGAQTATKKATQEQGVARPSSSQQQLRSRIRAGQDVLRRLQQGARRPVLGVSRLPYGSLKLPARAPAVGEAVVPSYRDPADPAPTPADLSGSAQAPLSQEILLAAEGLGYDYVRIFNYVRSQVETEWYAGSMKGAAGVLRDGSGNHVDQAALLIALLRAANVPARFVHGVAELGVDDLADDFGVEDGDAVAVGLRRAGVAHRPVVRGGRIDAFEVEYTWVSARIPYSNYRGAVVDFSGPTWLPLAPAVKTHSSGEGRNLLAEMSSSGVFDVAEFVSGHLNRAPTELPLTALEREVDEFLASREEERPPVQVGIDSTPIPFVPNSLPFEVISVHDESPALAQDLVHLVRFLARTEAATGDPLTLDWTVPLSEVAGRRVTFSYQPASVEDQEITNLFGGLGSVPLYLIQVRPQIKVDGRVKAVGQVTVNAGVLHPLEVQLLAPWGSESIVSGVISGGYYSLTLAGSKAPELSAEETPPGDTEFLAARLLAAIGTDFTRRWHEAEEALGSLSAVRPIRPMASLAIVANQVAVEDLFGIPEKLRWEGVTLDAAFRPAEAVRGGASSEDDIRTWRSLSALQGSALEHDVFERLFLVDAVSADKGIALTRAAGGQVEVIDSTNLDTVLPGLGLPAEVTDHITDLVHQGLTVEVVPELSRNAWQGRVWRALGSEGDEFGYFLSGGLAGGATSEEPESWLLQYLAEVLASPYSAEPNPDPLSAASIRKVPETDGQQGTVNEVLSVPLQVEVADASGRPVFGASVHFGVASGGGMLLDEAGTQGTEVVVLTDSLGRASVRLRLGQYTDVDPLYVWQSASDEHPQRALANHIEAAVETSSGLLPILTPFDAVALPGEPALLRRTDTDQTSFPHTEINGINVFSHAGTWFDSPRMAVEDEFGNPVANVAVQFSVDEPVQAEECPNAPSDPIVNAKVFDVRLDESGQRRECPVATPLINDCGSSTLTVPTSSDGTSAGVLLGDSPIHNYYVDVSAAGLPPLRYTYYMNAVLISNTGACLFAGGLEVRAATLVNDQGQSIYAARPGQPMGAPIDVEILYYLYDALPTPGPSTRSTSFEIYTVTGDEVALGLDLAPATIPVAPITQQSPQGDRFIYRGFLTGGSAPVQHDVRVEASGLTYPAWVYYNGQPVLEMKNTDDDPDFPDPVINESITTFWTLNPSIDSITPAPIGVGADGRTTSSLEIAYSVDPPAYVGRSGLIEQTENGSQVGFIVTPTDPGSGVASAQRGIEIGVDADNQMQLVVNPGSLVEVRSDPVSLPLAQPLFDDVSPSVLASTIVDLPNQRACKSADRLGFTLLRDATLSLEVQRIAGLETDGSQTLDPPQVLIAAESRTAGDYAEEVTEELAPGIYLFTLSGQAANGQTESHQGTIQIAARARSGLPVGHTFVHQIDVWDGHLVMTRRDLAYSGRGPALEFRRAYSSGHGNAHGPLGVGWSHNLAAHIQFTDCGEAIVVGAEGSGMTFVDDGAGGLRPLKGYHGSLVVNSEEGGLDFYPKGGARFHFGVPLADAGDAGARVISRLEWVEDANGNRLTYFYEAGLFGPRPAAVVDDAGRRIQLAYEHRVFQFWEGDVIVRVDGPDGSGESMSFDYDALGNLVRAARETDVRVEAYAYADPFAALERRHTLIGTSDELNGAQTNYETEFGAVRATADVVMPTTFYAAVTRPEGGRTEYAYDLAGLDSRAPPELTTTVTDSRGAETIYTTNQYGSVTRTVDPVGATTQYTWAADDVLLEGRTDANGVVATWTHDEFGNVLTESIIDADETYTRAMTYHPPSSFDPPYLKDRLASIDDRKGATTTFAYDQAGNLTEERTDGLTVSHTYTAGGDRASTSDRRGATTGFRYDEYGNTAEVIDALGGTTVRVYDLKGQLLTETDPLGRTTEHAYDTLGRRTMTVLPQVLGESASPTETVAYDDVNRTLTETDAQGRVTTTVYDAEGRVNSITDPTGATTSFAYDGEGNKVSEIDGRGNTTSFTYDLAGRAITQAEPEGRTIQRTFDPVGNVTEERIEGGLGFEPRVTRYAYDALNRRVEVSRINASETLTESMTYDGEGNVVESVDALGRVTETDYDAFDRPVEKREPLSRTTQWDYDGEGNVVEERKLGAASGTQTRTFAYDPLGRRTQATAADGGQSNFEYDAVGNLSREIDPRLNVTSHTYDARNRRASTTEHLTRVSTPSRLVTTEFGYDAVGNLTEERRPNGNVVRHTYDGADRRVSTTDSLGRVEERGYDANGNLTSTTDGNGQVTTFVYDDLDRRIEERFPEGRSVSHAYDASGNRTQTTDGRGHTTEFVYDPVDRMISQEDALGQVTSLAYDAVGNLTSRTDRRGHTTTFTYDALDRVTSESDPEGTIRTTTYDAWDNLTSATDGRGITTLHQYDAENRRTRSERAGRVLETVQYDPAGNRRFVTDGNGNTSGFEYDERNLILNVNLPLAGITRLTLDDMGEVIEERDPELRVTTREYDLRQRVTAEIDPLGNRQESEYDLSGNQTLRRRPGGGEWVTAYDALNRITTVTDPLGHTTTSSWDEEGNLTTQTDARGQVTSYVYDELNRLSEKTYPDTSAMQMTYDAEGNVASSTDPLGQVVTTAYDARNRPTLVTYSPPATPTGDDLTAIASIYDGNDHLTQVTETYSTSGSRVTTQSWDQLGNLERVETPEGVMTSTWDAAGNRTRMTDPSGKVTHYAYDARNRLASVTLSGLGVTEYDYLRDGRISSIERPNGITTSYAYDGAGRIEEIVHAGATTVARTAYSYDSNGNRATETSENGGPAETTTYSYDSADRLTQATYPDRTVAYTLDPVGNRTREVTTVAGTATSDKTLVYDTRDRLTQVSDTVDPENNATYSYNPNGNLTSADEGGVAKAFVYDQRDRLVQATEDSTPVLTARYDWQGRRIEKDGEVGMRKYLWDGNRLVSEHDASGATLTTHYAGLPSLTAPPLASHNTSLGWSFLHEDGLGSIIATTALSSSVAERTSYDAWGKVASQSGFAAHDFGFTAHLRDSETNTLYARARDYDPGTGRFLTEDPFAGRLTDPPTQHPYLYARANPTTYVDPSGQVPADPQAFERTRAELRRIAQADAERQAKQAAACAASGGAGRFCGGLGRDLLDLAQVIGEVTATAFDTGVSGVAGLFDGYVENAEVVATETSNISTALTEAQRTAGPVDIEEYLREAPADRAEQARRFDRSSERLARASGAIAGEVGIDIIVGAAAGPVVRKTGKLARHGKLPVPKGTRYVYVASAGQYRDLTTGQFISKKNLPYPGNRGFASSIRGVIGEGETIGRYGPPSGRYAGPPKASASELGLPVGSEGLGHRRYKVLRPIEAEIGPAAAVPEFGASGGEIQYFFDVPIEELLRREYLEAVP